jgi:hypothetical protein
MNESSFFGYSFPPVQEVLSERALRKLCRDMDAFYKAHTPPPFPRFPQLSCRVPEKPSKQSPLPITATAENTFLPENFSLEDSSTAPAAIRASLHRKEESIQGLERRIANLEKKIAEVPFSQEKRKSNRITELQQQLDALKKQLEQLDNREKIAKCRELEQLYTFSSEDPSIVSSCETTRQGIEKFIAELKSSHEKSLTSVNAREIQLPIRCVDKRPFFFRGTKKDALEAQLRNYPTEQLQFQLKMKLLKPLTLKEALVFFAQQEDQKLVESNPSLAGSLNEFKELMANYLKEKTEMQHLIRLKQLFLATTTAKTQKEAHIAYSKFLSTQSILLGLTESTLLTSKPFWFL